MRSRKQKHGCENAKEEWDDATFMRDEFIFSTAARWHAIFIEMSWIDALASFMGRQWNESRRRLPTRLEIFLECNDWNRILSRTCYIYACLEEFQRQCTHRRTLYGKRHAHTILFAIPSFQNTISPMTSRRNETCLAPRISREDAQPRPQSADDKLGNIIRVVIFDTPPLI